MPVAPDVNWLALLPFNLSLLTAVLVTILGFYISRRATAWLGIAGLVAALIADIAIWGRNLSSFDGAFKADNFALGFGAVLLVAGILALLSSLDFARRSNINRPEFYAVLLYAVTGTLLLASAHDLIVLLIGFEIMSLGVYVLSSFQESTESEEAGMKYFLLGSLASAILIYGIALVFGATGTFNLERIHVAASSLGMQNGPILAVGALLMLVGFGFKVAFAPFHQWTPDVYVGAPTLVTQYMSVGIKAAAFAGFLHIFGLALPGVTAWQVPAQFLIALTMLIGNLAALRQTNLKRMLAYSSIAHAGYLGLSILSSPATAWPAALYYLAIYTLMNAGALIVVNALSVTEAGPEVSELEGLGAHRPVLAAALGFLLLSLAGIPPLAGFFGKYVVFASAVQSGYYGLVVLGALTSAASLYYYLKPIQAMYFKPANLKIPALPDHARGPAKLALAITVLGIMILGTMPNLVYDAMSTVGQIVASR